MNAASRHPGQEGPAPLEGVDALFADLDGVVYSGERAIPYAVETLRRVASHMPLGFITNNASRSADAIVRMLHEVGLALDPSQIVTSSQAAIRLLQTSVAPSRPVMVVGGRGFARDVEAAGFSVTASAEDRPAAILQGFSPDVGWEQLAEASFALARDHGILWIATNSDMTLPHTRGIAPGNGALVAAVAAAAGRSPTVVAGKPETPVFEEARARFGAVRPLFVGDRLDTDIRGANRSGMASALVLTGITRPLDLFAALPEDRPDHILMDLRDLLNPAPAVQISAGGRVVCVGESAVRVSGDRLEILDGGQRAADLLRASAHAIWMSGRDMSELSIPTAVLGH